VAGWKRVVCRLIAEGIKGKMPNSGAWSGPANSILHDRLYKTTGQQSSAQQQPGLARMIVFKNQSCHVKARSKHHCTVRFPVMISNTFNSVKET
jgi:hypothetical protein